ncbi:hypothetical protein DAEQUDRAFT_761384 [Daedalea quercina L-15889]|uniref:Pkr1-domain-containing protein n=1 Tax=Daedalea quercina L-15889 TaxID=1314783 RepID=A0A165U8B4_9APHY|nr:hypothetical protein DAEQUDRAFT_761384 [Daedalea quercina L-15889]
MPHSTENPLESAIHSSSVSLSEQSLFSTLLTPGSSLHPTLLLLLDVAFFALFLVFLSLAIVTRGNVHLLVLMLIEVALWVSVKWFVSELQKVQIENGDAVTTGLFGDTPSIRPKEE